VVQLPFLNKNFDPDLGVSEEQSTVSVLMPWWKVTFSLADIFERQTARIIKKAVCLPAEREVKTWLNEPVNAVFNRRPCPLIMEYHGRAPDIHPE
jgi:hypothetical protein